VPTEEHVERVMAVTRATVAGLAARFLVPANFALTALGPAPGGPLTDADWPGAAAA